MSVNLSSGIGNNYNVGQVSPQPQAPAQQTTTATPPQAPQTTLNPVDSAKIDNLKSSSYDPASFKMPEQKEEPKPDTNQKAEAPKERANGLVAAFAAFASIAGGSYVPEIGEATQKNMDGALKLMNTYGGSVGINPFGGISTPDNEKSSYQRFVDNNKALNESEKAKN